MDALLTSPIRKDKKDQLLPLIASELNQQALCSNPSGEIQIHENITITSLLILAAMQIHAH